MPTSDNASAEPRLSFRALTTRLAAYLAMALLMVGPASFLILEDAGSILWALTVLAGLMVACTAYRKWWPELAESRGLLLCFGIMSLYLAMPLLSYFLIDSSEFASSRLKRQLMLLGIPFVFILFWWLRLRVLTVMIFIALNAVAFGGYALWFHESRAGRVDGVTHAVLFGDVSLLLSFASLALFFVARQPGWRLLAVAGVVLGGSASLLSGARGGWVAVPVLMGVALIATGRALKLKRSMMAAAATLIILVLVGLWNTQAVQTRVSQARHDWTQLSKNNWRTSLGLRVAMWEQAWMEIRESPVLGTGFSGYRSRILESVETGKLPKVMLKFATEPHNEYLYQWMTRGFPGLFVFLMCLSLAGWYFFRLLLYDGVSGVAVGYVGLSLITVVAVSGLTITVIDERAVIRFLVWIVALLIYCSWVCGKERTTGKVPG